MVFENRWFLEPQPSTGEWIPPPGGELLWLNQIHYQVKLAWGTSDARRNTKIDEIGQWVNETGQWQAFNSTDGKGTWWWQKNDEEWFLESEPGNWAQLIDTENNQPYWCHPDGRFFCASLEPWLIE